MGVRPISFELEQIQILQICNEMLSPKCVMKNSPFQHYLFSSLARRILISDLQKYIFLESSRYSLSEKYYIVRATSNSRSILRVMKSLSFPWKINHQKLSKNERPIAKIMIGSNAKDIGRSPTNLYVFEKYRIFSFRFWGS